MNQKESNSAAATNILSMFEATDSYSNMEVVFADLTEQLARLQRKATIEINGVSRPLRIFYFGDTEFLCKTFGHMGPSSSYPCLWCHMTQRQMRAKDGKPHCPMKVGQDGKWVPDENWPKMHTLRTYQQDLADLLAEEDRSRVISGHDYHSMAKKPLLPLPFDILQIVPPSLHILLGLVVRYFKKIEEKCRQIDQGNVQDRDTELYNEWQSQSEMTKAAELIMMEAKEVLDEEQTILKRLKSSHKGKRTEGLTNDPCCMPMCKLTVFKPEQIKSSDVTWIQCTKCGEGDTKGWYHTYCVGISNSDFENEEHDNFECPICRNEVSGPQDVIRCQEEKVDACKALAQETKCEYAIKKKDLDETYDKVCKSRGECEERINRKLAEIGVQRQAYHSQCFVGNHCVKILENIDLLLDVLPKSDFRNIYTGLFKRMHKIFKLFKSGFLTEDEVDALKKRCWDLGTWFPKKFPLETIPPKLHMLVCHVPEFVEKWRTVGLLSEHGLESVHKDINSIERIYCTVRDAKERMRLVIGNHQQRAHTGKAAIQVSVSNKKTCYKPNCKGLYKARCRGSKERVCQICGDVVIKE